MKASYTVQLHVKYETYKLHLQEIQEQECIDLHWKLVLLACSNLNNKDKRETVKRV